jgi:C-terminal processing protease CtpA/Prc
VVAVLTSAQTASSGEAVDVAFRGRPNTRTFGRPTFGVSTANTTVQLSDSSMLLLTTARFADRLGNFYGYPLPPDERVEAERNADPGQDATVAAAAGWLATQPCPQR